MNVNNSMKTFNKDKIDKMYKYYEKNREKSKYIPFLKKKIDKKNKIFIIVPFRQDSEVDFFNNKKNIRKTQKKFFIEYFKKILDGFDYYIFIIEQRKDGQKFNRGLLLNIGAYLTNMFVKDNDILIFHNLNSYPEKDILPYYFNKPKYPNSITQALNINFDHNLDGILSITYEDFKKVNGFPNNFFGKGGGENIAIYNRITKNIGKIIGPKTGTIKFWNEKNNNNLVNNRYSLQNNLIQKEQILTDLINWKDNGFKQSNFIIYDISDKGNKEIEYLDKKQKTLLKKIYKQDYDFINNFNNKTKKIKLNKNENKRKIKEFRVSIIRSDKFKKIFFYNKYAGSLSIKLFIYETELDEKVNEYWHINNLYEESSLDNLMKIDDLDNEKYKDYERILLFQEPINRFKNYYVNEYYNKKVKNPKEVLDYLSNLDAYRYPNGLQIQTSSIKPEMIDKIVFYKNLKLYLTKLKKSKVKIIKELPTTNITVFKVSIYEKLNFYYDIFRKKAKKIYLVNGLRRSGNHLFLGYLISGLKEKTYFLNNIASHTLSTGLIKDYRTNQSNLFDYLISKNIKNLNKIYYDDNFNLVFSIEDKNVKKMNMFYDILKSRKNKVFKIIVIRDIYNTMSSRLKKADWNKQVDDGTINYWNDLYKESEKKDIITFNYNKFICDKYNYREKLNKSLSLKNPIISISKASGGSSFSQGKLISQDKKSYFTRFENFKNNEIIKKLLKDKEMLKITKKDFYLDIKKNKIDFC